MVDCPGVSTTHVVVLVAALCLLGVFLWACGRDGTATVSGTRARELVAEGATLVDVRTEGEYRGDHVPGAVNVPVGELSARMAEIPRDRPVVVYCQSGGRSARAASELRAVGYTVHDMGARAAWPD